MFVFIGDIMCFDYRNVLIMGYAKSGKAVEEIIKKLNVKYKIYYGGEFKGKLP